MKRTEKVLVVVDMQNDFIDGVLENPARMKEIRKTIARIKTVLTERQNERAQ